MARVDRTTGRRRSRPLVLVVCGGERTETEYVKGLRGSVSNRAVDVRVLAKGRSPLQVVEYAIEQRGPDFDEVWCVVDVDDFDLDPAVRLADERGVRLAVSNPCFELWLLLHHTDCRAHCTGYADVARRLKKYVPDYDKTRLEFADYASGVGDAVTRAEALDPTGTEHRRNTSTGVWRVARRILEEDQ